MRRRRGRRRGRRLLRCRELCRRGVSKGVVCCADDVVSVVDTIKHSFQQTCKHDSERRHFRYHSCIYTNKLLGLQTLHMLLHQHTLACCFILRILSPPPHSPTPHQPDHNRGDFPIRPRSPTQSHPPTPADAHVVNPRARALSLVTCEIHTAHMHYLAVPRHKPTSFLGSR